MLITAADLCLLWLWSCVCL